jgi:TFIIF-interacting CTD phosphatase-like protein
MLATQDDTFASVTIRRRHSSSRRRAAPRHRLHNGLVVLDMDETLLHAQPVIGCSPRPDSRVIQFEFKEQLLAVDYVTRPGVFPFLDQLLVEGYKLAVFTAGIQPYADAVLDSFDPTGRYFGRGDRFYRQHMVGGKKDLRAVFGDDLSGVVLIDDNAHDIVPEDQLDHAVCVDHWRGDPSTTPQALASLKRAAKALANKQSTYQLPPTASKLSLSFQIFFRNPNPKKGFGR